MSIQRILSAGFALAAVAAAALVVRSPRALAYAVTGDSLALDQRDVRVFNNFGDPSANSNHTPDPSWPGYVGAELACWKACVEWASELHGDGNGDPQQPLDLGSGGANFDPTWQGDATAVGGTNDNVMSELNGLGGGVLAFTETPTSDGWRIRFYSDQTWFDDPNKVNFPLIERDLQGIATHEYGHALGLNHSSDFFATMYAFPQSGGIGCRSIEADDVAGIQSIYGAKSAAKPHVAKYALPSAGMIDVTGSNFAAAGNELWFTQLGSAGDGTPVKEIGLVSSAGGTRILASIPAGAGPGDLLVKVPGSAHDALSNPFPFNPNGPPCLQPIRYGTAKTTSTGQVAHIDWLGEPSASVPTLSINVIGPPPNETAVLFWGFGKQALPFAGGELSISRPFKRQATVTLDFLGYAEANVPVTPSMIGTTRYYQYWFSDPADPFGVGTSDALEISFCP